MHQRQIWPTIRCTFCKSAADRVCHHPICNWYPFLCPVQSKCAQNKDVANMANALHSSHSSTQIVSMKEFRKRISGVDKNLAQQSAQEVKSLTGSIKSKIDILLNKHLSLVKQSFKPKMNQRTKQILAKLRAPSSSPSLEGKDINFIFRRQNWCDTEDPQYKKADRHQHKFRRLMSQLDDLLSAYEDEMNQKQPNNDSAIPLMNVKIEYQHESKHAALVEDHKPEPQLIRKQVIKSRQRAIQASSDSQNLNQTMALKCIERAKLWAKEKRLQQSMIQLKEAEKLDRQNWEIYFLLGKYAEQLKQPMTTITKYYRKSIRLNKKNPQSYYRMGLLKQQESIHSQSIKWFDKALKYDKNSLFYFRRGVSQVQLSVKEAIQSFTQAYVGEKNKQAKAEYIYRRAEIYYRLKQYEQALSDIKNTLNLNPQEEKYLKLRDMIQSELRKFPMKQKQV